MFCPKYKLFCFEKDYKSQIYYHKDGLDKKRGKNN